MFIQQVQVNTVQISSGIHGYTSPQYPQKTCHTTHMTPISEPCGTAPWPPRRTNKALLKHATTTLPPQLNHQMEEHLSALE